MNQESMNEEQQKDFHQLVNQLARRGMFEDTTDDPDGMNRAQRRMQRRKGYQIQRPGLNTMQPRGFTREQ